jgi:hypothetical protein
MQVSQDRSHFVERTDCQIFWCDQRAFKDDSAVMKDELETEIGFPVKTYRTADMCTRLLKKKRHWSSNSVTRLFLVSWANAQLLVPFLMEEPSVGAKVVILCDTCGSKGFSKANSWAQEFPIVDLVAASWPLAIQALKRLSRGVSVEPCM